MIGLGGGFLFRETLIKWFKHYSNAHTNKLLQALLDQRNGAELYGRYFLLLELLCSEFKDDTVLFTLSNKQLRDALLFKSNKKLDDFFNLLSALSETFDQNLFNFYKNTNLFYKIETPIVLELMGKNFKKKRQTGHREDPKKEEKEEEKEKEKETRKRRTPDELNALCEIDFDYFMNQWNDTMCPPFPACKFLPTKRKTSIRRLLEQSKDFNLDDYLRRIFNSPFLRGEKTGWKADFSWCFQYKNYLKVIEGKYDHSDIKTSADVKQDKMLNILKEYENADRKSNH